MSAPSNPPPRIAEVVVRYRGSIFDVRHVGWSERDPRRTRYTLGESPAADLVVAPSAANRRDDVAVVIALEHGFVLGLPPGVRGRLGDLDLAEASARGRHSLAIPDDAQAHLELGELTLDVALVPAERPERGTWAIDRLALVCHAAAVIVLGGWILSLEPSPPGDLEREDGERLERVARYLARLPPTAAPTPPAAIRPVPVAAPASRVASRDRAVRVVAPEPDVARPDGPPRPVAPRSPALAVPAGVAPEIEARFNPTALSRRASGGTGRTDSEHDFDRVAGWLGDPEILDATDEFTVAARISQRHYAASAESDAWWAEQTSGPPRMSRHFGGLELAETERGGGVHDETRPKPAAPSAQVALVAAARPLPPPSAEEMKKIRRLVTLEIDPPHLMPGAGIDAHDLHVYMRKRSGALRACYESALDLDDTTGGCMQLQIRFDERGVVERAWVDWGTLNIERINRCLVAEIRRWKVPPIMPKPSAVVLRYDFSARTH